MVTHKHDLLVLRCTATSAFVFELCSYLPELITLRVNPVNDRPGLTPFAVL